MFGLRFFRKIFPSGSNDSHNILFFHAQAGKNVFFIRSKESTIEIEPCFAMTTNYWIYVNFVNVNDRCK